MPLEEKARIMMQQSESEQQEDNVVQAATIQSESPATTDKITEKKVNEQTNATQPLQYFEPTEEKIQQSGKPTEVDNYEEVLMQLAEKIDNSALAQKDLELKIIQTLKENANFQIQVRQNMQKELEDAKKKLSGDIFIPLLKEIAELYVEWQDVLNELDDSVTKKKVAGIFEVLQEMLEEYGCEFGTSNIDSKRRPKYSKLKNKVPTRYKEKHETIAKSHNPWIVKEPFVLYPEFVDVYVYDSSLSEEKEETSNKITNNNILRED